MKLKVSLGFANESEKSSDAESSEELFGAELLKELIKENIIEVLVGFFVKKENEEKQVFAR